MLKKREERKYIALSADRYKIFEDLKYEYQCKSFNILIDEISNRINNKDKIIKDLEERCNNLETKLEEINQKLEENKNENEDEMNKSVP